MYRVGVDLGGTNIVVGVVDEYYKIIAKAKRKTACPRPAGEILKDIALCVQDAVRTAGLTMEDVQSIGIGTPGSVNKKLGMIEYANNLDFDKVPAREILSKYFTQPIYLENDANCAALGEAVAGAGGNVENFVAITLGTGVGSGIIVNGKIVNGCNDAGGEMGHSVLVVDGEPCTCGRRGCWEAYSSATALVRQTRKAMRENPDSVMWEIADRDLQNVNGRTAFEGMRRGDRTAQDVVDTYIKYLAAGITNAINIFQPDVLCVGGGIGCEGEPLLEPVRRYVEKERYSIHCGKQTRICSAVLGNDAGIIGAALLNE
ncbi:MAG TPA: ROK family protein [Candidatus Fimenecus excrementigallinarum]|uniref:ROK family protein n=1 Tax=Candidatus Fimenecus excrementigallinarum TaxID=2840816 RepID=A0A9D1LF74_9FIRM|nr:ROK family protein [Candidatus Fimenecus excrementigallinarum]